MIMIGKVEWVSIGNENQESLVLKKPMMSNEYEDSNHASNLAIIIFLLMSLQQQEASLLADAGVSTGKGQSAGWSHTRIEH